MYVCIYIYWAHLFCSVRLAKSFCNRTCSKSSLAAAAACNRLNDIIISNIVYCMAFGLYKIFFHLFVCARVHHPFITPAHLNYPHYCNTTARLVRNTRPPPDPPWLCHTLYHIGNDNIVYRLKGHTKGGSGGRRILRNRSAIVLQ